MSTFRGGAMNDGHHVRLAGRAAYECRISSDWHKVRPCRRVYDNWSVLRIRLGAKRRLCRCRRMRLIVVTRLRCRCLRLELHTQLRLHRIPFLSNALHGKRTKPNRTEPNRIEPFGLLANSQLASRNWHPIRFGP